LIGLLLVALIHLLLLVLQRPVGRAEVAELHGSVGTELQSDSRTPGRLESERSRQPRPFRMRISGF
jgi:hypothetical protein